MSDVAEPMFSGHYGGGGLERGAVTAASKAEAKEYARQIAAMWPKVIAREPFRHGDMHFIALGLAE